MTPPNTPFNWEKELSEVRGGVPTQEIVNTAIQELSEESSGKSFGTVSPEHLTSLVKRAIRHKLSGYPKVWSFETPSVIYRGDAEVHMHNTPEFNFPPENPDFRVLAEMEGTQLRVQIKLLREKPRY